MLIDMLDIISKLNQGIDLSSTEAENVARAMVDSATTEADKMQILTGLAEKGESVEEVCAFARIFREMALEPCLEEYAAGAIDIVGTGGDKSCSFNISTATAFIVAASGVNVIKNGNRSITSKCGSADLIEAVGIPLQVEVRKHQEALAIRNFTFLFAPVFHPVFKSIVPIRKALASEGKRSIFNILGPLINPAQPRYQLMGVFSKEWVKPLAEVPHQSRCETWFTGQL